MATDISLLNNVIQVTVDGGQPIAFASAAHKYNFNAAGTILTIKNQFQNFSIPLADLRIAGAGTAPADAAAAYTALSSIFQK